MLPTNDDKAALNMALRKIRLLKLLLVCTPAFMLVFAMNGRIWRTSMLVKNTVSSQSPYSVRSHFKDHLMSSVKGSGEEEAQQLESQLPKGLSVARSVRQFKALVEKLTKISFGEEVVPVRPDEVNLLPPNIMVKYYKQCAKYSCACNII